MQWAQQLERGKTYITSASQEAIIEVAVSPTAVPLGHLMPTNDLQHHRRPRPPTPPEATFGGCRSLCHPARRRKKSVPDGATPGLGRASVAVVERASRIALNLDHCDLARLTATRYVHLRGRSGARPCRKRAHGEKFNPKLWPCKCHRRALRLAPCCSSGSPWRPLPAGIGQCWTVTRRAPGPM